MTIRSAIEPGSANLQVDPLELISQPIDATADVLDDFISLADFDTPLSHVTSPSPVDSIPANTKSQVWQETVQASENHEDTQQRHFHSSQPKGTKQNHRYQTRSKSSRSANTIQTADNGEPTKFVYLRDKGEKYIPVWKQYEFIL